MVDVRGIDRSQSTTDPRTFTFEGHIISIPYTSPSVVASLESCGEGREFGQTYTDDQLNTSSSFQCRSVGASSSSSSSSWLFRGNAAFTDPPASGPRAVVEFTPAAVVTEPARVFVVGVLVARLPLLSEVLVDFGGNPRTAPPGVGAWAP